jgi:hypothetical protein
VLCADRELLVIIASEGIPNMLQQLFSNVYAMPAEPMVATTAKDMPRTVAEVQACKRMIQQKYIQQPAAQSHVACVQDMPPWPDLTPRPQRC